MFSKLNLIDTTLFPYLTEGKCGGAKLFLLFVAFSNQFINFHNFIVCLHFKSCVCCVGFAAKKNFGFNSIITLLPRVTGMLGKRKKVISIKPKSNLIDTNNCQFIKWFYAHLILKIAIQRCSKNGFRIPLSRFHNWHNTQKEKSIDIIDDGLLFGFVDSQPVNN